MLPPCLGIIWWATFLNNSSNPEYSSASSCSACRDESETSETKTVMYRRCPTMARSSGFSIGKSDPIAESPPSDYHGGSRSLLPMEPINIPLMVKVHISLLDANPWG